MSVTEEIAMKDGPTLRVLSTYLNNLSVFACLKEIPQLVELQKLLSHLTFRLKRVEAEATSIADTIKQHIPKANRKRVGRRVVQVIKLWRELHAHLTAHPRFKHHVREIPQVLNMQSPLVHFLHSQDVRSIPLLTFLVNFHNDFLDICSNNCSEGVELSSVGLSDVKEENVIRYGRDDVYRLV